MRAAPNAIVGRGPIVAALDRAGTAWVVEHWTRRIGRPPADGELEPMTAAYLREGRAVDAGGCPCRCTGRPRGCRPTCT